MVVIGVVGCGEPTGDVAVQGQVSYRGEPLSGGAITFFPATGRRVTAAISEGEYSAKLPPGEYVVVINVGANLPPGFQEGDPIPPPQVVLPPEYTTRARSKLTATVREGNQQPIDFKLE